MIFESPMADYALPEKLTTARLVLRRARYEDAEQIFYCYASKPEATRFVAWPTHQSLRDTRSFLSYVVSAWQRGTDFTYTVRLASDGRLIGSIGAINDNGKVQFGYILGPAYWGRGYATEMAQALIAALKEMKGLVSVFTFVDVENVASIRVLVKSGLVEDGLVSGGFAFVNQDPLPRPCKRFILPL